ncbi:MAG: hypothetical protein ACK5MK_04120 [Dysgonomonas sp.]
MRSFLTVNNLICLIVVAMATALLPFIKGSINYLLVSIMCLSPIVIIRYPRLYKFDTQIIIFLLAYILCARLHPESFRWSTVCYTILFCTTFLAYMRLLNEGTFTIENYLNLIRFLLYAYCAMLIIQQGCRLLHLPIINGIAYRHENLLSVNSLALEPSQSARLIALFMFCYISMKETLSGQIYSFKENFKEDRWVWLSFAYPMLTMGSSSAFIFIALVLLKFLSFKKLIPFILIAAIASLGMTLLGGETFERTERIFLATLSLDENTIIKADPSGSIRIVPIIICFKLLNPADPNFWIGNGIDYVSGFLYRVLSGIPKGFGGGGLFGSILDNGVIPIALFLWFVFSNCIGKKNYLGVVFILLLVVISGINLYTTWSTILLFSTNKYFENKYVNT